MKRKIKDIPLTLGNFIDFYNQHIEPRFLKLRADFDRSAARNSDFEDSISKKIEILEDEYYVIRYQLRTMDGDKDKLDAQLKSFEAQLDNLMARFCELERKASHQQFTIIKYKKRSVQTLLNVLRKVEERFVTKDEFNSAMCELLQDALLAERLKNLPTLNGS